MFGGLSVYDIKKIDFMWHGKPHPEGFFDVNLEFILEKTSSKKINKLRRGICCNLI